MISSIRPFRLVFNRKIISSYRFYSTIESFVASHDEITSLADLIQFQKSREEKLQYLANDNESLQFRYELSSLQSKALAETKFEWKNDLFAYGLVKDAIMWLDKECQGPHLLRNCYLSFFASLFADRHGCIYNMSEDSIPSSFTLSLYSGYNKLLFDPDMHLKYKSMIQMNALEKRIVKDPGQPVHTILYTIPDNLSIPPFPKKKERVMEIETTCNLNLIYNTIHKAEKILRSSQISEKERKSIPTERSLYMICPSILLPYIFNHFHNRQSFDVFCSSLLSPSDKPSKEDLLKSDVLIRAFFEEKENSEETDFLPPELFNEEDVKDNTDIDIEIEEVESTEKNEKTQFITFPTISLPSSSEDLDEDMLGFINQIPGYGTYSFVCLQSFSLYCDQLADSRVTTRKKAGNAILNILNDNERKNQILQIELFYPESSFIVQLLQRFKRVILLSSEGNTKSDCISSLQLFFSFVLLLSQNESVFKKYCCIITEIVYTHIKWTIDTNLDSASYMIHICTLIFSNHRMFFHCNKEHIQSTYSMLIEYIKENEVTSPLVSDITHCIFEYWRNCMLSIDRSDVPTLFDDYFSLFPSFVMNANRLPYFLCLDPFLHHFPTETSLFVHQNADTVKKLIRDLFKQRQIEESFERLFPILTFICNKVNSPMLIKECMAVLKQFCLSTPTGSYTGDFVSIEATQELIHSLYSSQETDAFQQFVTAIHKESLHYMQVIESSNTSFINNAHLFTLWMIDSFCLSSWDSSQLQSDFMSIRKIATTSLVGSSPHFYTLYLHILCQYAPFLPPTECSFLLSILQKQLPKEMLKIPSIAKGRCQLASRLIQIWPQQLQKLFYTEYSQIQQFSFLSSFLDHTCNEPTMIDTIASLFLSQQQSCSYWKECFPFLVRQMIALNSSRTPHSKAGYCDDRFSFSFFLRCFKEVTGCAVQKTTLSPLFSSFLQASKQSIAFEGSLKFFSYTQYLITDLSSKYTTLYITLCHSIHQELKEELANILKDIKEVDFSKESLQRMELLVPFLGISLNLCEFLINTGDSSAESIKNEFQGLVNDIVQLINRLEIHTEEGACCWMCYLQFLLLHPSSLLDPLHHFYFKIFDHMIKTPSLYLFRKPTVDEVFVPNIFLSSNNNDKLLFCFFQRSFITQYFKGQDLRNWIKELATISLNMLPHRPFLRLALVQVCLDFIQDYEECHEIISHLFSDRLNSDLALFYLAFSLSTSSSLLSLIRPRIQSILESVPPIQNLFMKDSNLLFIFFLHSYLSKKQLVPWLFFILKTVILQSSWHYQQLALPILQKICQKEETCKLVESFCHSLIKKEWKENTSTLLCLSEMIQGIVRYIPSLYSYLFCSKLFVSSISLSNSYLFYSIDSIPSVLICDLQYSFEPTDLIQLCNRQEHIYISLLGYYYYLVLCQNNAFIQSAFNPFIRILESCPFPYYHENPQNYPVLSILEKLGHTSFSESIQYKLIRLLSFVMVQAMKTEGSMSLSSLNPSLQMSLHTSINNYYEQHLPIVIQDCLNSLFMGNRWTEEGMSKLIQSMLVVNQCALHPTNLLFSLQSCLDCSQSITYVKQVIQLLSILLSNCKWLFTNMLINRYLLFKLKSILPSNVTDDLCTLLYSFVLELLHLEEEKWLKLIPINLHAFAVVLNGVGSDEGRTMIQQSGLASSSRLLSLCFAFPQEPETRIQNLLTCIQEDCDGYWEWIADSLPTIKEVQSGTISQPLVKDTVKYLLSYYSIHSYGMDAKRISKFHSLLHYCVQLEPSTSSLLQKNSIFVYNRPSSFQSFYLTFCNSLILFLYNHMDCDTWSQFYLTVEDFLALLPLASCDQSAYPYIFSLSTHKKKNPCLHDTCTLSISQQSHVPVSFPGSTFDSLKSFTQTLMSLVIHQDSRLQMIRPLLLHITELDKESEVFLSLITVLLYEGTSSPSCVQIGQLLKEAFSYTKSTIIHECILRALNQLRPFILYDYNNKESSIHQLSTLSVQSSASVQSIPSQPTVYLSPFDLFLQRLELPLDVIIHAATSLKMPLTSLLWIHSTVHPVLSENSKLYSWNTILNYPSVISGQNSDSEECDETQEFEIKRRKVDTQQALSIKDSQLLNTTAVSNYLALKNPHAAMSITRDDQLEQQLHIQLQAKHLGFSSTYQMFHAYSMFFSKKGIDVNPYPDLWRSRPWKALTQWREVQSLSKEEIVESLTDTIPGLLLQLEMDAPQQRIFEHYEQILSSIFHSMVGGENWVTWHQYREYHELFVFLKHFSENSIPRTSLEKQLYCNLMVLKMQSQPKIIENVVEVLVQQFASLQNQSDSLFHRELSNFQEEREREMNTLRYELEILRQFITDNKQYSISKDHESLLLLELSKNLYSQGFSKLAIATIRTAENQASSLISSTCRLEELKLTSANEDESRKLILIRAMCSILDNNSEADGWQSDHSGSLEEPMNPSLLSICHQKRSYCEIGMIIHDLYRKLENYYQSTEYSQLEDTVNQIRLELDDLKDRSRSAQTIEERQIISSQRRAKQLLFIEIQNGPNSSSKIEERLTNYKEMTIECYLKGMVEGEHLSNRTVYSFINLWFHSFDEGNISTIIQPLLRQCNVKWFIPLAHQIISRVGQDNHLLHELIRRLTETYPYHIIPYLLPICCTHGMEDQSQRAKTVNAIVASTSIQVKTIFSNYKTLFKEYHDLICLQEEKGKEFTLPSVFTSKANLRLWSQLPILTISLPVQSIDTIRQANHLFIKNFGSTFSVMATGITVPKKVTCISQTGVTYLQMAKKDEIRSDVVVEQLFDLINGLLDEEKAKNTEAADAISLHQILLRTYRIISITSQTGVLEFVRNSLTIRDYLVNDLQSATPSSCAHGRYHKGEILNRVILQDYRNNQDESKERRLKRYQEVTKQFTPVFHYFFLERFYSPSSWYYSIQNFISTLSVSSIVGYIVGLGDRHLRNIMIDEKTGQLIHIDFGILFERGRLLSVPEMVPFRLTREFVDCLGMEGVDGLLKQQMEYCLQLIRQNKELILTVLEVFLHDPLNSWKVQCSRSENEIIDKVNTSAEQVLFKIENKIVGRDLQNTESISVEKQVDVLIKAATNENNLAVMFYGWGPWLLCVC